MTTQLATSPAQLADEAVELATAWHEAARTTQTTAEQAATGQLAALVSDPAGLDVAVRFIDRVVRPEDNAVAARELARLSTGAAGFLSGPDRMLLRAGALLGRAAPDLVVPLARRRLRQLIGHLLVDATDPALARHLAQAHEAGARLNLNLLGEAVLGEEEAAQRTRRTIELLHRPDVDYVSVKVSSLVSQLVPWNLPGSRERVLARLRPVYRAARQRAGGRAFVNLDMEEYRDLDLTIAVLDSILAEDEFADLEVGVVLQAYLPDSVDALEDVIHMAEKRRRDGGAGIKVRLVKGANLAMEKVEAELRGWPQAPYQTKAEVDANYIRLIDRALDKELAGALRLGVASHNLFDVSLAHLLATRRDVAAMLDIEMLQGMAPAQGRVVGADVGQIIYYTPIVDPADFDVAVSYLVRRLEENAGEHNYLHAMASDSQEAMAHQEQRFRASVDPAPPPATTRRRTGDRPLAPDTFANTIDSDPALPDVRAWGSELLATEPEELTSPWLATVADVDEAVARGRRAAPGWQRRGPEERARLLRRAADELEARRGRLLATAAHEGGKTLTETDPEVSEAIDFARYYADRAAELAPGQSLHTDGSGFSPLRLSLVTPPWNFPVAIPIGGVLAALASGSAVIIKPSAQVPRCTEIAVEALHAAGIDADAAQVVRCAEDEVGHHLVAHDGVAAVQLTGAYDTARHFLGWRAGHAGGPGVIAETSGKNSMIITPAADIDLAVDDLLRSAFGHAGQKCSAASLVILVGSMAHSERFRRQLHDAVTSLSVGYAQDLGTVMGPLIGPPEGKLQWALHHLEEGEEWLVVPQQLDVEGRLWSPGVREGVAPDSYFHRTECFGPVLGVMTAPDLPTALELQNATDFGLTAGLHSLDEAEIDYWLDHAEAGNLYVNRHMTGAIVNRQTFGGWKASVVGPGAKAGGPNYVAQFGHWVSDGLPQQCRRPSGEVRELYAALEPLVKATGTAAQQQADRTWLRAAIGSDAMAWGDVLGRVVDESGLAAEGNMFRYRALPRLQVRAEEDTSIAALLRLVLGAQCVGAGLAISLAPGISETLKAAAADGDHLAEALRRLAPVVDRAETTLQFLARVEAGEIGGRIRVLGPGQELVAALAARGVASLGGPVLATGRRELLTMLREQAMSITRHRFGHVEEVAPHFQVPAR